MWYSMQYYTCEACKFQFVRYGEVENCPDCGKAAIRFSTEAEIEQFKKLQEELKQEQV